jgi:hypothetical protein
MTTHIFFLNIFIFSILGTGALRSEDIDGAMTRFLNGDTITAEDLLKIEERKGNSPESGGISNNGTKYLEDVKVSILDPVKNSGWPTRSPYVMADSKTQKQTYLELKAIYEKNKTPLLAYALVCPAMYVDDMEILPELIAKIGENKPLKARFDDVYKRVWKPRLDPDL